MKTTSKTFKTIAASALAITAGLISTQVSAKTPTVKITNFIGTIDIKTGDYDRVRIVTKDGAEYEKTDDGITIDAGHSISRVRCRTRGDTIKIAIGKSKWFGWSNNWTRVDDYPNMVIHAPKNAHIDIDKSLIFATIGDVGSANIQVQSCGDLRLGDVAGDVELKVSGAGDVEMGTVGNANLYVSGAGDVSGEAVQSLTARISGSGDLSLEDINGFTDIKASGSGDVSVGAIADGLRYIGSGSSDLDVKSVGAGDINIKQSGAGDVDIDDGNIDTFQARVSGASDIHYGGTVKNADVHVSGAASISMRKPTEHHDQRISGAGSINFEQ